MNGGGRRALLPGRVVFKGKSNIGLHVSNHVSIFKQQIVNRWGLLRVFLFFFLPLFWLSLCFLRGGAAQPKEHAINIYRHKYPIYRYVLLGFSFRFPISSIIIKTFPFLFQLQSEVNGCAIMKSSSNFPTHRIFNNLVSMEWTSSTVIVLYGETKKKIK